MNFKVMLKRLKNPGTIVSLTSLVILILTTNGIQIDNEKVMTTVKAACAIGVILGALNDPNTPGLDLPSPTKPEDADVDEETFKEL